MYGRESRCRESVVSRVRQAVASGGATYGITLFTISKMLTTSAWAHGPVVHSYQQSPTVRLAFSYTFTFTLGTRAWVVGIHTYSLVFTQRLRIHLEYTYSHLVWPYLHCRFAGRT